MRKRSGFTLVELLTVMAVAGLLTAIGLPALNNFKKASAINDGIQGMVSTLRQAQAQAVAGQGNSNITFHLDNNRTTYSTPTSTANLTNGVTVTSSVPLDVTFKKLSGISIDTAGNQITSDVVIDLGGGGTTKHIHVSPVGNVSIQ